MSPTIINLQSLCIFFIILADSQNSFIPLLNKGLAGNNIIFLSKLVSFVLNLHKSIPEPFIVNILFLLILNILFKY